jgi:two-component system sensor histidine kinase/response regulator
VLELLKIGITENIKSVEAKRIYFVNALALLCVGVSILMIIPYIMFDLHVLAAVCIVFAPIYVLSFNFNSKGKYKLARTIIFSTMLLNIFILSIVLGNKINMATFYLPLIVVLFLIFEKDQKKPLLFSIFLVSVSSIVTFLVHSYNFDSLIRLKPDSIVFINTTFNIISLLGTIILSYVFVISSDIIVKYLSQKNKKLKIERDELYESTIKLNKTTKEQEELSELKSKLISIISHDVRQPVNNVLSVSEIMIHSQLSNEEMVQLGLRLKESSLHVYQMLENLLTWSYSQMNGLHPQPESILVYEEIKSEIQKNQQSIEKKQLNISVEIDVKGIIFFDKIMFQIIFRNIFNNAIKFSPPCSTIKLFATLDQGTLRLSIEDEGIGITDELKAKLFVNDLSKSRYGTLNEKGAGIGLLLCKELIEANNGSIEVNNKQKRGTTFIIFFPN